MGTLRVIVLLLFVAVYANQILAQTDRIVCYFGSWSVYRYGNGKFDVENIDPTLCTHLIFTFAGLHENGQIKVLDPYNELDDNWGRGAYRRFVNLKKRSPTAKTMIAIGGWNEGSEKYSKVMADDTLRSVFVQDAVAFLKKFKFDGFDIDWEYPNQRGGKKHDVDNFVTLLKELKAAFAPEGFILSAAVAAAEGSASQSYRVPEISRYLDFINIMAYDLHGSWETVTGHQSALYPSPKDITVEQRQLNVNACVEWWLGQGADPAKLNLGMPTYGRSFTLNDPSNHGIGAPASSPGNSGPYTNQVGFMGYNEIVEIQNKGGWNVVWDKEQEVPYAYSGNQWIGYDTPKSIALKVDYAKSKRLGGTMIWSIETDDFLGLSGVKFAILRAINAAMGRTIPPEPTESPISSTTGTYTVVPSSTSNSASSSVYPTTEDPSHLTTKKGDMSYLCHKVEFVRDPTNCSKFYYCVKYADKFEAIAFYCDKGLVFDTKACVCNYPYAVKC